MRTVDQITIASNIDRAFRVASEVERWPEFLPHYRSVVMHERRDGGRAVEMAAWRPFGVVKYPTWWVSEMTVDASSHRVRYRHVRGITRGMDVEWQLTEHAGRVLVTIVHEWSGPAWPLIGSIAANLVIGPVFIHYIAGRTLAGVKQEAERT